MENEINQNIKTTKNNKKILFVILILIIIFIVGIGSVYYLSIKPKPKQLYSSDDEDVFARFCQKVNENLFNCEFRDSDKIKQAGVDYNALIEKYSNDAKSHCNYLGYTYKKVSSWGSWGGYYAKCYNYTDGNRTCSSGNECQSGYCIPHDNNCEENCSGECEVWKNNKFIESACDAENYYLVNGEVTDLAVSPRCIHHSWD